MEQIEKGARTMPYPKKLDHDHIEKIKKDLALAVRKKRIDAKISSQEKLAESTGISRNSIGEIELAKKNPNLITFIKISLALNTLPSELLKEIGL